MKKLLINIIAATMLFLMYGNTTYANVEKVKIDRNINENLSTAIDTSELMCDTQPVFGNDIYLQVDTSSATIPDKYKKSGFSNSPLYVYDSDLNLIKSIEFENYISGFRFIDGYFYFTKIIYGDDVYNPLTKYYKSVDSDNWIEISKDDFTYAVHSRKLYDGTTYTWKQYSYEIDGMVMNTMDRVEYLINNTGDMYKIETENNKYVYSKGDVEATDLNVCVRTTRNPDNYNDLSKCIKSISLDGVSMFDIPNDSDTENMWNDDTYLYIGILDDNVNCYRISLKSVTDFIKVKYKNKYLSFTTPPTIEDGSTLVPMRFLFEQMGADVSWDNETRTAEVSKEGEIISFSIDNTEASVNGSLKTMDVPARLINDKTMIPIRFLSENLGYTVSWDGDARMVTITAE